MNLVAFASGDRRQKSRRTVKDQIRDKLAYMIHSGLLLTGDELSSERDLAATLGVARETVRSAIGVLQTLLYDVASDFYDNALEYRRRALLRAGAIADCVAGHLSIVAALDRHDAAAAVAAVRSHLAMVHKTALEVMGK